MAKYHSLEHGGFEPYYMAKPISSDKYEALARKYIEGSGGLFDFYAHEFGVPAMYPPEVEGARWILRCLTNPENKADLAELVKQAELRAKGEK